MTDKQIIIDGVDVSECEFYGETMKTHNCTLNYECLQSCKGTDCYYKNWQRKEQECKNNKTAYQMELDIYNQECLNLQEELKETLEQLDQLKAENEELKKIIKRLDVPKHEVIDMDIALENEKLKDLNTRLDNQRETYWKGYQKLEQTLKEIKEIAENGKRFAERWMITGEQKANVLTYANAILQKISKCEVVDDKSD